MESDKINQHILHRGSYMSAFILLNLLNELGKKIRCEAMPSFLSVFRNEFNKFNNTGARLQDSISHVTLKSDFISENAMFYGRQCITLRRNLHI